MFTLHDEIVVRSGALRRVWSVTPPPWVQRVFENQFRLNRWTVACFLRDWREWWRHPIVNVWCLLAGHTFGLWYSSLHQCADSVVFRRKCSRCRGCGFLTVSNELLEDSAMENDP